MEYTADNSFGYDQITTEMPKYFNKGDSSLLYRNQMHPNNEMRMYMDDKAKGSTKPDLKTVETEAFNYYLRKNIKDEIEKYAQRDPKYTGAPIEGLPQSSGYSLCDASDRSIFGSAPGKKEGMFSGQCQACRGRGVMTHQLKYDNILFIILVVVVAFCMTQFTNIQNLQSQINNMMTDPLTQKKVFS